MNADAISKEDLLNAPGETYSVKLTTAGSYTYYCEPHQGKQSRMRSMQKIGVRKRPDQTAAQYLSVSWSNSVFCSAFLAYAGAGMVGKIIVQ